MNSSLLCSRNCSKYICVWLAFSWTVQFKIKSQFYRHLMYLSSWVELWKALEGCHMIAETLSLCTVKFKLVENCSLVQYQYKFLDPVFWWFFSHKGYNTKNTLLLIKCFHIKVIFNTKNNLSFGPDWLAAYSLELLSFLH